MVERLDDGRYIHTFRQSTVGELDTCPDRGRATMAGEMPRVETDAAATGTACHAGFEAAGRALLIGDSLTLPAITAIAQADFTRIMCDPSFAWMKYTEKACRAYIERACETFYDELYHRLEPELVEFGFGPLVVHEDAQRVIQITGTCDLFDTGFGAADYKTTDRGRKYERGRGGEAWKLDRWAIQPTTYTEALRQLGYLPHEGPWPFTFFVFELGSEVRLIEQTVWRTPADVAWMVDKLTSYAELVEADIRVWPKQDNHELCSPKWCPRWDACKGAHYPEGSWPLRGSDPLDSVQSALGMVSE